ncbi:hypothetical protein L1887_56447 [Cichorium endivia]|nr:hypothetical protein L1887_56447 [Cichorium endivia]
MKRSYASVKLASVAVDWLPSMPLRRTRGRAARKEECARRRIATLAGEEWTGEQRKGGKTRGERMKTYRDLGTPQRPAVLAEVLGEVVGDALGAGEDDDLAVLLRDGLEVADKLALLLKLGANLDDLLDVVVCGELGGANVDLGKVVEEVAGKTLHLLGPGGGEHERLTVGANLLENLADLGLETHVEHAVGLVHDEVGDAAEVGLAGVDHVDQTTRGGDDNLGATLQVAGLGALGHTTVDGASAQAARATEAVALDLDLVGELTRGGQDEGDGTIAGLEEGLSVDVNHGGEGKADGLTRTGLGDGDEVATAERHGPGLRLDGRRLREAHLLDFGKDVVREASLVERGDGLGDVLTLDGHLLGGAVVLHLAVGAGGDARIFDVEVLLEVDKVDAVPVDSTEVGTEVAHAVSAAKASTIATAVAAASSAAVSSTAVRGGTAAVGAASVAATSATVAARAAARSAAAVATAARAVAVSTVRHDVRVDSLAGMWMQERRLRQGALAEIFSLFRSFIRLDAKKNGERESRAIPPPRETCACHFRLACTSVADTLASCPGWRGSMWDFHRVRISPGQDQPLRNSRTNEFRTL